MIVDVKFLLQAQGKVIPADHAYSLYSAISKIVKTIHEEGDIGIHSITGTQTGDRGLLLGKSSCLVLRLDSDRISEILPLAGKCLAVEGTVLPVGIPSVYVLSPSPFLRSRLVTIKGFMEEPVLKDAILRQCEEMEISNSINIALTKRRTLRIHNKDIVGYEVYLSNLTESESIRLQEKGLGGRRKMGCGIFLPCQRIPVRSELNDFEGGK
ncbi:MAG: type I-MYXAN CRISPR-associated protein Cas6/Cmx6 [Planctomycetia bacterium]|nr:type I-MYXAN CRISPR-associated protein Cas6/Cmx6 [Planctomycetia bacterium]